MAGWKRAFIGIFFPAVILLVCVLVYQGTLRISCPFYKLTGLYCPGCGSGRAAAALFHGHVKEAFLHNVLLFPMGIPCAVILIHEYLRIVFPGLGLKPVFVPQSVATGCTFLLFLYWVLRNLPAFAFLAP